jgi:hypothetical protein
MTLVTRRVVCVTIVSGCNSHPATGSLQPVAIEATRGGNETVGAFETNVSFSDAASRQAVTQVNVEQASKSPMCAPTQPLFGEGRSRWRAGKRLE